MKLTDLKPEERFFGLFIGRSKSGKSCAAASFPKPLKLYDMDDRAEGILGAQKWIPDLDKIEVVQIKTDYSTSGGVETVVKSGFTKLEEDLNVTEILLKNRQCQYKTLMFDSMTSNLRLFLSESLTLIEKGKKIGRTRMPGPPDYSYESEAMYQILDMIRYWPINIIFSAHIVDRFGKADSSNEFSESVVVGEKLSIRDKIGENALTRFGEVYKFEREENGNNIIHYVKFRSDIANTSYTALPNGRVNITGINFYNYWREHAIPSKV